MLVGFVAWLLVVPVLCHSVAECVLQAGGCLLPLAGPGRRATPAAILAGANRSVAKVPRIIPNNRPCVKRVIRWLAGWFVGYTYSPGIEMRPCRDLLLLALDLEVRPTICCQVYDHVTPAEVVDVAVSADGDLRHVVGDGQPRLLAGERLLIVVRM